MWSVLRAPLGVLVVVGALLSGCGTPAPGPTAQSGAGASGAPATAAGSVAASGSGLSSAQLARIPHFGAPPPARPVTLPAGASAGWFSAIPTDQPVAFITMDDGWTRVPQAAALLQAAHVPVTLFLEINAIKGDPGFFEQLEPLGATIEAHTISHPDLKGKSYDVQKHEICGGADQLATLYGHRPVLFRPPFGDHDATTLRAVHDCGMKAAFYWKETTDKGIVRYQEGNQVRPGDIILMHFRPAFIDDFIAVLQAISAAGLTPARLEDYIP